MTVRFLHIHLTLTGTLPFFALFVTESLARDCLIVEGDAFAQHGIAFSFSAPMDRHIQRPFFTHQQHAALGTRDCRVEKIPRQEHIMGSQQWNNDRIIL